ncbi:MAG: type I restriction enzyme HsdR N-terminal domain-containing protein [Bacteroidia bacterium]|nr:type I restriction enzyme HsdR N-terminal domain-containing protein [Bacteroidia bacterium]
MNTSNYSFPNLQLPSFEAKIQTVLQRTEIFDVFRKRFVLLSPEEWVRQHMLHYMVGHLGYPPGLLGVEVSLRLHGLVKRADIVLYDRKADPWMLVECKAAHVQLNQNVFDQAARYNVQMRVPYLVITNGNKLMAAEINQQTGTIRPLQQMPVFNP